MSNPRRNSRLASLRKNEVVLVGFFASAYPENTNFVDDATAFAQKLRRPRARRDIRSLVDEWKVRRGEAGDRAFGTRQIPFILNFDSGPYVAFVPDLMVPDELVAFKHSVMVRGLRLAEFVARKVGPSWTYELR